MKRLTLPCRENSQPVGHNEEHGTPIRNLLSQASMRIIGKAFDKGIIKEGDE